jgi:hypothetical protein
VGTQAKDTGTDRPAPPGRGREGVRARRRGLTLIGGERKASAHAGGLIRLVWAGSGWLGAAPGGLDGWHGGRGSSVGSGGGRRARESGCGWNEVGERERVWAGLKKELGCVGRRHG